MSSLQFVEAVLGLVVTIFAVLFGLAKVMKYVLDSFHNEHVAPKINGVSSAIERNTEATERVANALGVAEELQRAYQTETGATFTRMGQIIEDHEDRITALEPPQAARPARIRGKRT